MGVVSDRVNTCAIYFVDVTLADRVDQIIRKQLKSAGVEANQPSSRYK